MRFGLKKLFFVLSWSFFSCSNHEDQIKPSILPITESVYSSVTIQPDSLYEVYAAVSGIVDQVFIEEGDLINEGETVIKITDITPRLNEQNSKLVLDLKRANYSGSANILAEQENEIAVAALKLKNDSIYFVKQKKMWKQNIGTKNEFDNRKLNYEVARKNLDLLQNKYERTRHELEAQLKQAENSYISSYTKSKDYIVRSKIHGKVYKVHKSPGELVSGQEPIASIGSEGKFIIEMLVDEVDIIRIKTGQEVLVVLDAYGEDVFFAKVSKIVPSIANESQTFLVEGEFENQPEILYSGLTGEANIIISKKEAALSIPLDYLMDDTWAMTTEGKVKVETGVRNFEYVEIISGLDSGSVLIKPN
ncbi:efflux RND transporter periplasmic adaptor subunit [Ekhidna sp.]